MVAKLKHQTSEVATRVKRKQGEHYEHSLAIYHEHLERHMRKQEQRKIDDKVDREELVLAMQERVKTPPMLIIPDTLWMRRWDITTMLALVFTAIVTPFTPSGEVDWAQLEANVEFQIENGINGLVPVGTTGDHSAWY